MRDAIDIQIIRSLQEEMPVTAKPYAAIAEKVGVEEGELLQRLQRLQSDGVLRRIGAVLHHRRSGVKANAMVVWKVPDNRVEAVGMQLSGFADISHCYHRGCDDNAWPYNLFTMVHGATEADCLERIRFLAREVGTGDYEVLFSTRELKKTSMRYFSEE